MEGIPALQLWEWMPCETFTRRSGKRHSLSYSIDLVSLDMFDHVPNNNPERLFPARQYIFVDNEAATRTTSKKVAFST